MSNKYGQTNMAKLKKTMAQLSYQNWFGGNEHVEVRR